MRFQVIRLCDEEPDKLDETLPGRDGVGVRRQRFNPDISHSNRGADFQAYQYRSKLSQLAQILILILILAFLLWLRLCRAALNRGFLNSRAL